MNGRPMISGEYIAFLDSDDAWLPEKLELQRKALEQFSDVNGACYVQCIEIRPVSEINREMGVDPLSPRIRQENCSNANAVSHVTT